MKQNKYDDPKFFEKYKAFPRSVDGLAAAGEWHELQKMLPTFVDKRVLDIGCGFGWHCFYAAELGAQSVLGTDISEKMLTIAREKNTYNNVRFEQIAMEDLMFDDETFDVVISSLAFHYTSDFPTLCANISRWLVSGGDFVFSVEHPVFTAEGAQDWNYDKDGTPLYWPVDRYFAEGERTANFLGEDITKYHKTLTTYLQTLIQNGFIITNVVEPKPAPELLETVPGMKDELRRPMMLLVSAKKLALEL